VRRHVGHTATFSDVHCKWPLLLLFCSPVAFRDFNTIINPRTRENPSSPLIDTQCSRSSCVRSICRLFTRLTPSSVLRNECCRERSGVFLARVCAYCAPDIVRVCVCARTVSDVQHRPLDSTTTRNMYVIRVRWTFGGSRWRPIRIRTGRFDGSPHHPNV